MTHRDEIDKFLFDLLGVLPGCCSSIESVKYTIARTVAEALWPKKDSALTWEDMAKIDAIILDTNNEFAVDYSKKISRQQFYEEVLKRFNGQRNGL